MWLFFAQSTVVLPVESNRLSLLSALLRTIIDIRMSPCLVMRHGSNTFHLCKCWCEFNHHLTWLYWLNAYLEALGTVTLCTRQMKSFPSLANCALQHSYTNHHMDGVGGSGAPNAEHLEHLISLIAKGKKNFQWLFAVFHSHITGLSGQHSWKCSVGCKWLEKCCTHIFQSRPVWDSNMLIAPYLIIQLLIFSR